MMVKLGEVCTVISGSTPKTNISDYWDGDIKWITPAELDDGSFYIFDSQRHISILGKEKTGLSFMPKGTVILSSRAPIGKTAIAGCELCCNQGFKNLVCSDKINNEYLYYFLKGKTEYLNSLGRGATFKEISKSIVENIEIPLPDIGEQKRIANLFNKIYNLINLYKQQLVKLEELIKSRFIEMFGDMTLGGNQVYLEDISDFVTVGIANSATHAYADSGIVILRNQNIKENYLDENDLLYIKPEFAKKYGSKQLVENDILVIRTGYPGVACLVPKNYEGCQTFTTLIVRLKDSSLAHANYVCHYINSSYGKDYVEQSKVGVAQQNFGAKALAKMPIVVPPMELQEQFTAFVEQTDKSKLAIQQSLDKLETLKKSLMQKYFG
ncbi:MAG: restriction endonuclease subunit S [Oscillospiraceae bacterium]|nr:restriction endonuclease subunit S [Oscillospiraceae bacterium]